VLKPEIKSKWVEALRSGEYAQGRGAIRNKTGFCCLGVLCDVLGATWGPVHDPVLGIRAATLFGQRQCGALTATALEVIGLEHDVQARLITMNDCLKSTFAEIADMIEEAA